MKKLIKRREIPGGNPVSDNTLLDRLYRSRHIKNSQELDRTLQSMLNPNQLYGIQQAVNLLVDAYQQKQKIVIVGDFDADGATSTALSVLALRMLGFTDVEYLVPNRFEQGYGLSVPVAEMAMEKGVQLLTTVDNGVSSFEGVVYLKEQGVKVLITDHHLPPEILPNADAIVNPNLQQCDFPSKCLAGVGVAFYLMLALRAKFRELGIFTAETQPNFTELLDLVALGTIADVVPLDQNNRILAHQGLMRIRAKRCRPGIIALAEVANREVEKLCSADLGFAIAPRLNAAGRLDNMSVGVELLLVESMQEARAQALDLDSLNQARKEIEQGMKLEALEICRNLTALSDELPMGITLFQPDWHQGVLGLVASRIKDQYHRPVIAFAQDQEGILKGSARSIEGLHMRDVLERIHSQHPDMILKFGGHAMAAGLSIKESFFPDFQKIFNQTVQDWLNEDQLQGVIWTDGELQANEFSIETAEVIKSGGPWGQAFPEPVFDGEFKISRLEISPETYQAWWRILFDSGVRYHYGNITFNHSQIREDYLNNILNIKSGEPYLTTKLSELTNDFSSSNWFSSVLVQPNVNRKTRTVDVDIILYPRKKNAMELGVGFSTDGGIHTQIGWTKPWINSRGHSFRTNLYISAPKQAIEATYRMPLLKNPLNYYYDFSTGWEGEKANDTDTKALTLSALRYWNNAQGWQYFGGLRARYDSFTQAEVTDKTLLFYPTIGFTRTRLRGGTFATWGDVQKITFDVGNKAVLSETSFMKVQASSAWIRTYALLLAQK